MKLRSILFSTPMVQAIMEGRKTQTRRIVKPMKGMQSEWLEQSDINLVPHGEIINGGWQMHHPKAGKEGNAYDSPFGFIKCPYGQPGDVLWVRETFCTGFSDGFGESQAYHYKADDQNPKEFKKMGWKWKPSLYMPYSACRNWLKIKSINVERLQDISEEDAKAEGVRSFIYDGCGVYENYLLGEGTWEMSAKGSFGTLWQSINGSESWQANVWTWAITFERIEKP